MWKSFPLWTAVGLALGLALITGFDQKPTKSIELESRTLLIPPKNLKHFVLGYSEVMADTLWIRSIQDFDLCEQHSAQQPILNSNFSLLDPSTGSESIARCKRGWVFHMLDAITELAPQFRTPYTAGGTVLSVLIQDIHGASVILGKGLERFPSDGEIAYQAAYHALYEERDLVKARDLLLKAGEHGAPKWVYALAARISSKVGQAELGRSILLHALELKPPKDDEERIRMRLKEIEEQLAKAKAESGQSSGL